MSESRKSRVADSLRVLVSRVWCGCSAYPYAPIAFVAARPLNIAHGADHHRVTDPLLLGMMRAFLTERFGPIDAVIAAVGAHANLISRARV